MVRQSENSAADDLAIVIIIVAILASLYYSYVAEEQKSEEVSVKRSVSNSIKKTPSDTSVRKEEVETARNNTETARSHLVTARSMTSATNNVENVQSRQESPKPKPVPLPPSKRIMLNEWMEVRVGDPFPKVQAVRALDRSLDTLPGQNPDQYIALWYMQGEPVMGRIWNQDGKVAASFGWNGNEYNNVGVVQVLLEMADHVRGFDYAWHDFSVAAEFGEKVWHPVHVNNWKGDISPGVMIFDGKEVLGKVDVRNERASIGYGGKERVLVGPAVHSSKVLCRKAKPGCKFDKSDNVVPSSLRKSIV